MERVVIDDIDPYVFGEGSRRRRLSERLRATDIAINHYRIAAGEGFPGGLHAHMDQEEVFVVVRGEATFETMNGEISVSEGEVVRFAPGEFQSGRNEADDELVAVVIGSPRDTEDVRLPVDCPACGHGNVRLENDRGGVAFTCPDCGTERHPRACLECDRDAVRIALDDDGRTVAACRNCGAEFEDPPLRDER